MKKYLLLIPTLFVMLLNVIGCGQVVFNSSAAVDYSQYWRTLESYDEKYFYNDESLIAELQPVLSQKVGNVDYPYYFVCFYCDESRYSYFVENGGLLTLSVYFVFLKSSDIVSSNSYGILLGEDYSDTFTILTHFDIDDSYQIRTDLGNIKSYYKEYGNLLYYTNTSYFSMETFKMQSLPESDYINDSYVYLYQNSNIPDFPFPDFVNHGSSSSNQLKVDVKFDPELTDTFNRTINVNGKKTTLETINLTITNNSKFPIQYAWFIVPHGETFYISPDKYFGSPNGKVFSGNPAYAYVTDEWCYLPKNDGSDCSGIINTYTPSTWHYVSANSNDDVTVSFSQMLLERYRQYDVLVYAVRNDKDSVCVIPFNQSSFQQGYNKDYMIDFLKAELVYSSNFSIINPAEFDSSLNDNGSYAFDPDDKTLFNRASGYIDENGEVVIKQVDTDKLVQSPDSWGSQYDSDAWDKYYKSQNSVSSDINQLSLNFSSFFRFVNTVFGYFPKNFQSVVVLGLTTCVVIGILKVVF